MKRLREGRSVHLRVRTGHCSLCQAAGQPSVQRTQHTLRLKLLCDGHTEAKKTKTKREWMKMSQPVRAARVKQKKKKNSSDFA